MSIKNKVRNWLDVDVPKERDYTAEFEVALKAATDKLDRSFTQRIARFSVVDCINCGKHVIAGRDAVYTNFKGLKFCSHICIDEYAKKKA